MAFLQIYVEETESNEFKLPTAGSNLNHRLNLKYKI